MSLVLCAYLSVKSEEEFLKRPSFKGQRYSHNFSTSTHKLRSVNTTLGFIPEWTRRTVPIVIHTTVHYYCYWRKIKLTLTSLTDIKAKFTVLCLCCTVFQVGCTVVPDMTAMTIKTYLILSSNWKTGGRKVDNRRNPARSVRASKMDPLLKRTVDDHTATTQKPNIEADRVKNHLFPQLFHFFTLN